MTSKNHLILTSFSFLFVLATTLWVYSLGLGGSFIFDDIPNLQRINENNGATSSLNSFFYYLFSNGSTGGRAISYLSFLINDNAWPGSPLSYKLTNIYIHLLNGVLIFIFFRQLLRIGKFYQEKIDFTALILMSLWLLHPLQVSTVLYVVQRMTELSTLFSLLALIMYLKLRRFYINKRTFKTLLILFSSTLFLILLGFLSKENAVLTLLVIILLELLFYPSNTRDSVFNIFFILCIILPVAGLSIYFYSINYTSAFLYRGYTQYQHIITEARVLVDYIGQIISPNINKMGIIHDDFPVSVSLTQPISTLLSVLLLLSIIIISFIFRKKYTFLSFGILWFFSGHLLESSFIPIELYFEHRNYFPSIGLIFSIVLLFILLLEKVKHNFLKYLLIFSSLLVLLTFTLQTVSLTQIWSNSPLQVAITYQSHTSSTRAIESYAINIKKTDPLKALDIYKNMYTNSKTLSSLLIYTNEYCKLKKKLPFNVELILKESTQLRPIGVSYYLLENLTQTLLTEKCIDNYLVFLDYLFTAVENNKYIQYRKDDLSRIQYLHADIAHAQGDTEGSIFLLNEAFNNYPNIIILIRQADFLFVRNEYKKALEYINKAIKYHKKSNILKPSPITLEKIMEKKARIELCSQKKRPFALKEINLKRLNCI